MRRKTIKTQGDFEKVMSALQSELRSVIKPLRQEEDELRVRLSELNVQRSEKIIALQEQRTHWEEVMHLRDIREEKLACLAEGRKLKLELSRLGGGISECKMQLRRIKQKRHELAQPYHDKMDELIRKYPKGSLPMIAN